ncbi:MAG: phospholipid carrier-dependent glycosyltransferase [Anaerolineales bacterium]|nr:phospholipid carrier-dependent glycosyltransferase [Anaerolineales bacterium]MCB8950379.1 phospholipid carrier-dependent glycosyltransferase [Ardenticatenales bacterium]
MRGEATVSSWLARRGLTLILVCYAVLGVTYALATPPLESSDEYKHYPVVQYIQMTGRLPVLDADDPGRWKQEGAQPPLYYGLMALATAWIDSGDLPAIYHPNPHAYVGDPNQIKNKNIMLHDPAREAFPWQGAILAVYVIRLLSIGLGLGTITLTARLGNVLFADRHVGLLAAALTAFNPMFLFISAAVNNDSLTALLGVAGIYLLVHIWQKPAWSWRFPALGLILGLGILTKLSLGALLGLTGIALAWRAWQTRDWRLLLWRGGLVAAMALLVSGWWFWRNFQLYGDPLALNVFLAVQGTRAQTITLDDWRGEFGTFYRSFWGLFGGVNVAAPQWFYAICNGLALIGGGGLLWRAWRGRQAANQENKGLWLLVAWGVIVLVLLLRWTIYAPSFQGRLMFAAIGGLNILWAAGLAALLPRTRGAAWMATGWLLVMAALLPWVSIRPAYAFPQPLTGVPAAAAYDPIRFRTPEGEIRLVGVEMPPDQTVFPGENTPVVVTLYWQAVTPVRENYVTAVHLLGRELASVGQVDRYPGWGMVPTSVWLPGQIWRDPYQIYPIDIASAPTRLRLSVSLYNPDKPDEVVTMTQDGAEMTLLLLPESARLAAVGEREMPAFPLNVPFADNITLRGYRVAAGTPGEILPLTLFWQATGAPGQAYTVFVHLLDANGEEVQVADAPPVGNDYPTDLWRAGDWVDDTHWLDLPEEMPAGTYTISVGLYLRETGERLPRLDGQGSRVLWPVDVRP